jgi:hypothetical protein
MTRFTPRFTSIHDYYTVVVIVFFYIKEVTDCLSGSLWSSVSQVVVLSTWRLSITYIYINIILILFGGRWLEKRS